jgi:hypothetical protein
MSVPETAIDRLTAAYSAAKTIAGQKKLTLGHIVEKWSPTTGKNVTTDKTSVLEATTSLKSAPQEVASLQRTLCEGMKEVTSDVTYAMRDLSEQLESLQDLALKLELLKPPEKLGRKSVDQVKNTIEVLKQRLSEKLQQEWKRIFPLSPQALQTTTPEEIVQAMLKELKKASTTPEIEAKKSTLNLALCCYEQIQFLNPTFKKLETSSLNLGMLDSIRKCITEWETSVQHEHDTTVPNLEERFAKEFSTAANAIMTRFTDAFQKLHVVENNERLFSDWLKKLAATNSKFNPKDAFVLLNKIKNIQPYPPSSSMGEEKFNLLLNEAKKICADLESSINKEMVKIQKPLQQHSQAVYSLAFGQAFLSCNFTPQGTGTCTITLRTSENSYIKLRDVNVLINPTGPVDVRKWVQVGTPPVLFLDKESLGTAGEIVDIDAAGIEREKAEAIILDFVRATKTAVQERAFLDKSTDKLTVEMDRSGNFRVVKRRKVGEGSFKEIFKETIYSGTDKRKIARGRLKKGSATDAEDISDTKKEITLSQEFAKKKIPHIVVMGTYIGQSKIKPRIEMEYLKSGNLRSVLLRDKNQPLTPQITAQRMKYMYQMAETLDGIHTEGYVYNDFKLPNILLDSQKDEAKLTDFGQTRTLKEKGLTGTFPAPEYASKSPGKAVETTTSEKNDCWAFGVTLHMALHIDELDSTATSFHFKNGSDKIKEAAKKLRESLRNTDPDKLIKELLSEEPNERPPMKKVMERLLPFVQGKPITPEASGMCSIL